MSFCNPSELADCMDPQQCEAHFVVIIKVDGSACSGYAFADSEKNAYFIVRENKKLKEGDVGFYYVTCEKQMASARRLLMQKALKL